MMRSKAAQRIGEGLSRDDGEIFVAAHQRAKPAIFKLLDAPDLRDDVAVPRKGFFGNGGHRLDVVKRAIGIKDNGFDRHRKVSLVVGGFIIDRFRCSTCF
jgi:hypothetical protein